MNPACFTRVTAGIAVKELTPAHGYRIPRNSPPEAWNQWIRLNVFCPTTHNSVYLSDDGTETITNTWTRPDRDVESIYPYILIDDYDESYISMLTLFLSSKGCDAMDMASIVLDIHNYCKDIKSEDLTNKDYQVYNLDIFIPFTHDHVTCEGCYTARVERESMEAIKMVPASSSCVEKLLKKVEVKDKGKGKGKAKAKAVHGDDIAGDNQEKGKGLSVNAGDTCSVCLEVFRVRQCVLGMPCSHVFHGKCIKDWLKRSHFCPLCRFPMPTNDDDDEDEEEDDVEMNSE